MWLRLERDLGLTMSGESFSRESPTRSASKPRLTCLLPSSSSSFSQIWKRCLGEAILLLLQLISSNALLTLLLLLFLFPRSSFLSSSPPSLPLPSLFPLPQHVNYGNPDIRTNGGWMIFNAVRFVLPLVLFVEP